MPPVIEGLLRCPTLVLFAEPRLVGGGFCALFATINYSSHPASSPKTPLSNFDDCLAQFPVADETSFQDGVEDYLELFRLGVGTEAGKLQSYFEDTESLLLLDQHNPNCLPTEESNVPNILSSSCGPWTFDWTNTSNLPTSWDHIPDILDTSRDHSASVNSDRSGASSASMEDLPSDMPLSQWPLSFRTENLLSCPNDLSGPWVPLEILHVAASRFPNETPSNPKTPSNPLVMPEQEIGMPSEFLGVSDLESDQQSRSNSSGHSPEPLTSSPAESTTSSRTLPIACTWPQCKKSFPTRADYK